MVHLYGLRRGRDRIIVEFTPMQSEPITAKKKVMSSNPAHGEVYLIQHKVIRFASDLRQVGGFLRVLWYLPPIKLTATIYS